MVSQPHREGRGLGLVDGGQTPQGAGEATPQALRQAQRPLAAPHRGGRLARLLTIPPVTLLRGPVVLEPDTLPGPLDRGRGGDPYLGRRPGPFLSYWGTARSWVVSGTPKPLRERPRGVHPKTRRDMTPVTVEGVEEVGLRGGGRQSSTEGGRRKE